MKFLLSPANTVKCFIRRLRLPSIVCFYALGNHLIFMSLLLSLTLSCFLRIIKFMLHLIFSTPRRPQSAFEIFFVKNIIRWDFREANSLFSWIMNQEFNGMYLTVSLYRVTLISFFWKQLLNLSVLSTSDLYIYIYHPTQPHRGE